MGTKSRANEPQVSVNERVQDLKNDSKAVSRKERLSAYFTIAAAAFGLISDGCKSSLSRIEFSLLRKCSDQNNLMTMSNVVFKKLYPKDYTTSVSTRVSNALLVGEHRTLLARLLLTKR